MSLKSAMVNSLKNGVLPPDYRELIYGGRTKGGWQTGAHRPSTHGASPSRPTAKKGDARV